MLKGLWWVLNYSPVAAGSLLNDSLHEISWRRVWPAVLRWSQRGGNEENQHDREQNSVLPPDTMTKPTALMWQHILRPIHQHLHLCKEYTSAGKHLQMPAGRAFIFLETPDASISSTPSLCMETFAVVAVSHRMAVV